MLPLVIQVVLGIIALLSIFAVIAFFFSKTNFFKNKLNNFLKDYNDASEKKQKSIFSAISNMVIMTDKNLKVESVNIAVERLLRTSIHQVKGKSITEIIRLKDSSGNPVPFDNLPVNQALTDKATHFAEGYFLDTKIQTLPKPVTIQIKPVTDPSGSIIQVVFVLTDPVIKIGFNTHPSIKEALKKRDALLNQLTAPNSQLSPQAIKEYILLITHIEEDIMTVQEMEDHPLQEVIDFADLVQLITQILNSKKALYSFISNEPKLEYDDEAKSEDAFLHMDSAVAGIVNNSLYAAPIDSYLVKVILEKIMDFSSFISGKESTPQIHLSIDRDNKILIQISFSNTSISERNLTGLYIQDYPGIRSPGLQKSSGLEGYIAGKLSRTISLPLTTSVDKNQVLIQILIPKQPKISTDNPV